MSEPVVAKDYDDRGARAAHAVLIEIGQVLGAHKDAVVVIGGSERADSMILQLQPLLEAGRLE